MSSIFARGKRLYFSIQDARGNWSKVKSKYVVGQERQAQASLDKHEAQVAAGSKVMGGELGPVTCERWHRTWIQAREERISTWENDEAVMRLHVLPALGAMRLDAVRPMHLVDLVESWRKRKGDKRDKGVKIEDRKMAPKSIYNAYSTLCAFFRDAKLKGLIHDNPCILTEAQLGPKVDSDPEWRPSAIYTVSEVEMLISDPRIPFDRQVAYALQGIGGFRLGEVNGLRWRNVNRDPEAYAPLGMLFVACSYAKPYPKGDVCRPVPIHPTLAAMLGEWKLAGWARLMGRKPTEDDLVMPLPPTAKSKFAPYRMRQFSRDLLVKDLVELGLRHRRGHDLRRFLISHLRSSGADKDIVKRITHKPPKEVIDGYTTFEWEVVCAAMLRHKAKRRGGNKVLELPVVKAVGESFSHPFPIAGQNIASITKKQWPSPDSNPGESVGTSPLYTEQAVSNHHGSGGYVDCSTTDDLNQAAQSGARRENGKSAALIVELERITTELRAIDPEAAQAVLERLLAGGGR